MPKDLSYQDKSDIDTELVSPAHGTPALISEPLSPVCGTESIKKLTSSRNITKESGLIRELNSNSEPTFYTCTVFRQSHPLLEGALSCNWPADDCVVYYRTGGVTGDNCIVYDFYFLAARWTMSSRCP